MLKQSDGVYTLNRLEEAEYFGALFQNDCVLRPGQKIGFQPPVRFDAIDCNAILHIGAYTFMRPAYLSGTVSIGRYCSIGANLSIGEPDHPTDWMSTSSFQYQKGKFQFYSPMRDFKPQAPPEIVSTETRTVIGHDVWIGSEVMILRGVTIGHGAIIAAGAVVTHDVAPYTVVGGVPARKIRDRFNDQSVPDALSAFKWWEFDATSLSGLSFDAPLQAIEAARDLESKKQIRRLKFLRGTLRWRNKKLEYVPPSRRISTQ